MTNGELVCALWCLRSEYDFQREFYIGQEKKEYHAFVISKCCSELIKELTSDAKSAV